MYGKLGKIENERREKLFIGGKKICCKCGQTLLIEQFHKHKREKDGHHAECKMCGKIYVNKNKERISKRVREYNTQPKIKEKRRTYKKKYKRENKESLKTKNREYKKKIRKENVEIRVMNSVSNMIRCYIKKGGGNKNGLKIIDCLPYTIEELKIHLESQFQNEMAWNNWGEWHIDHIIPQSKLLYDSINHPNFQKCWALNNLQPLWAVDNIKKGNKL
jgi:hypothetical protein